MKKIIVISNTALSIEKFRLHYLEYLKNFRINIYTPWRKAKINKKFKQIKSFKFIPKNLIQEFLYLNKIISKDKSTFILCYSFKYQLIIGILSLFRKFNVVAIIAGQGSFFYKKTLKNYISQPFIKLLFSNFIKIICINNQDGLFFSKYLDRHISIIPTEGVRMSTAQRLNNKQKNFIFFSRLIRNKGIREYIELAKNLKKKYNHLNFYVAGPHNKINIGQSNSKNMLELIKNNSKYIKYLGNIKNYKNVFPKMDCLVSPSYAEGAGTSVLEAMMTRLFVIAYKNNGHNFILKTTKNIICDANFKSLTLSVEKYLKIKKVELVKITKNSRKRVIKKFITPFIAKILIKHFNKIIKSKTFREC
jgi:galacturonosyltransferase